jgi:hypothetical protein
MLLSGLRLWQKQKKCRTTRSDDRRSDFILTPEIRTLPGRLWYGEPDAISNAVNYARFYSRSHDAVIRIYDAAGNMIETHEQAGEFKGW